ncbi:hypothetical protein ACOMHN_028658 [Nucella lapillus]
MSESVDVTSSGGRRGGRGRRVVPLLPAQQSPSERVAHKNRVLQSRLEQYLNTLTKHRRSWLFHTHIQASRYRRRAHNLHHLLTPHHSPTFDPSLPDHSAVPCRDLTSACDVYAGDKRSRQRRPATSVQFLFSSCDTKHPNTAAHPRSKPTEAWNGARKPLFRTLDNDINTSSEDDDVNSQDSSSSEESETNNCYSAMKPIPKFSKKAHIAPTYLSGNGSRNCSVKKPTRRTQSTLTRTPKRLPASPVGDTAGRVQAEHHSYRESACCKSMSINNQKHLHGNDGSKPRAKTAPGTARSGRERAVAPSGGGRGVDSGGEGGGVGDRGGSRDSLYIHYVLNLERDKYELSQMKVRDYLQRLTI